MVRTILAALVALWVGSAHAQSSAQPILCDKVAVGTNLAAGTTALIAGVSGQIINICGWTFDENSNGTIQLVFGTGSSCTTATAFTSVITVITNGLHINHVANAFVSSLPGQSMCAIVTGTGTPSSVDIYYLQRP